VGFVAFCALRDKAPIAPFPLQENTMTTQRTRSLVSLAAALAVTLALGGCISAPSGFALDESAFADGAPHTVRFDNGARQYVHVYLVGEKREWLLGRVEPGARVTLQIPEAALAENPGFMRLAVLTGAHMTLRAASDPRAAITIPQPAPGIASQRWTFSQGQLTPLRLGATR
jgi:hypothetical protein